MKGMAPGIAPPVRLGGVFFALGLAVAAAGGQGQERLATPPAEEYQALLAERENVFEEPSD